MFLLKETLCDIDRIVNDRAEYFVLQVGLILHRASMPDVFLRMGASSFFLKPELPLYFTIKFSFGTADFDCCTRS